MFKLLASGSLVAALAITASLAISAPRISANVADDRIDAAFAMVDDVDLAGSALRSDRRPAECARAVWPAVAPSCLETADGRPAARVRVIAY